MSFVLPRRRTRVGSDSVVLLPHPPGIPRKLSHVGTRPAPLPVAFISAINRGIALSRLAR